MLTPSRTAGSSAPSSTRSTLSIWYVFLFPFAFGGALAQGNNPDESPVLDMRTTAEFLDPQERISGGATVGVVYYDPSDSVRLDAAYLFLAEPVTDVLEMHLATIDGRYLATFDYKPEAPISGWVRLNLSLSKPDFLGSYKLNEIALLMTNAKTGVAYPVRWGEQSEATFVRVYINTEGARSYFVSFDEAKQRLTTRSCTIASERSSFKFDRVCDVPVSDVTKDGKIEIIRKRGAGFGTPIDVTVSLRPRVRAE